MAGNQYQVNTNNQTWMSLVLSRDNLKRALTQVCRNKGGAGIDGMTVDELPAYLKHHWHRIKTQLMAGEYRPNAIKRVNCGDTLLPYMAQAAPQTSANSRLSTSCT